YMGLKLENPIIVASSRLSKDPDGIKRCADAGAGAVVLKSLFEEQIRAEMIEPMDELLWHPEAFEYVERMGIETGPKEYLKLIEEAKSSVSIPIIASLNCISPRQWADYAKRIELAGADGIELNIALTTGDPNCLGRRIEEICFKIVEMVKERVEIPIAVKLGPHFSSISWTVKELAARGASAVVLFNRFYHLDIDIESMEVLPKLVLSSPHEMSLPLRWISLLWRRVNCDLAATTGVHDGEGVIKMLLAGATAVQVCSTLFLNGPERIGQMLREIRGWMERKNFSSISQFRGRLSQVWGEKPELYERVQYIRALIGIE
ncbi:TPA: dihydroorotate dehydrogenase-like protein, partial [Candidatus Poribacteria bacterium]|nr:dihydroorotate dehydrogenase-like protein [Candidatus Poribacteria bacterium]